MDEVNAPETAATPRSGLETEQVDESTARSSSLAIFPLGSTLELRWDRVAQVRGDAWTERDTQVELRLRAVASWPWQKKPLLLSTSKISISSVPAESATCDLPNDGCVWRVELTPKLLAERSREHTHRGLLVVFVASLEPRRATPSGDARQLQFTLALDNSVIRRAYETGLRLEAPLCDQEGTAAGVACVRLRCGLPTISPVTTIWEQLEFVEHIARPIQVRVALGQLRRFSGAQKPVDVIVEVTITGQESSRVFRSRPFKLVDARTDLANAVGIAVLGVDDAWTQAVRIVVFQHSAKERAHRLAEGLVSLSCCKSENGEHPEQICVEMVNVSSSSELLARRSLSADRRDGDDDQEAWGELTATLTVCAATRAETVAETNRTAASLLTRDGSSGYEAQLGDVRGVVEIEVVDTAITGSAFRSDGLACVRLDLSLTPGPWSKQAIMRRIPGDPQNQIVFGGERFSAPIQWTKKERAIPSIGCRLTTMQQDREQETEVASNAPARRVAKAKVQLQDVAKAPARMSGFYSIQLPVLFVCPGEWVRIEIPIDLRDINGTEATARLRTRLRFNTNEPAAETQSISESVPYTGAGHLSVSNIHSTGPFLRNWQPHDVFAIALETPTISCTPESSPSRSVSRVPQSDQGQITWDKSVDCDLPPSSCAPIVVLKVFKIAQTMTGDQPSGEELVGYLSMPLPQVVLRDQHLVTFTLPLAAPPNGPLREPSCRKCGTLSFDMQFVSTSRAQQKRDEQKATTALVLQRLTWTQTPALTMMKQNISVVCELTIMAGKSLSQVLWQHTTALEATAVQSSSVGEYVINHSVSITNPVARKLRNAPGKSILIIRLSTIAREGGTSQSKAFGQAVVSLREGWTAFSEQEKDKWHKLYALGEHANGGNPDAVGEIQLSVVKLEPTASADERSRSGFDGWLFVQVVEAVADVSLSNSADKTEAFVELQRTASSRPQTSKPRWGVNGRWQWETEAAFVVPFADPNDGEADRLTLTLVVESERRFVVAREIHSQPYVDASRSMGHAGDGDAFVDEWLFASDGAAQLHLRIRYLPAAAGTLQLEMLRLQPQCHSTGRDQGLIPVTQLALRCTSTAEPSTGVTSPFTLVPSTSSDHWEHWQRLQGVKLGVKINTTAAAAVPSIRIYVLGLSVGTQEVCLGEASVPITPALISGRATTRWVSFHARHDASQRLAVASLRLQFQHDTSTGSGINPLTSLSDIFPTHAEWQRSGSSVLALWKRLFYRLDEDHNGRIDLAEFKNIFLEHTEVFRETSDGDMLLRVLLYPEGATHNAPLLPHTVEKLFAEMDRDHDESVVWAEYVDFLQAKLLSLEPHRSPEGITRKLVQAAAELRQAEPVTNSEEPIVRELRTKRKEDRGSHPPERSAIDGTAPPQRRLSVRQLRSAASREENMPTPNGDSTKKYLRGGDLELTTKLQTTEALLELERQKSNRLQEELRSLRLAHHQLQLQLERSALEEKTKESFVEEAIRSHEEMLQVRAAMRAKHHTASVKLQSKVRARLEQKKFQALKMQRWNAAVRLQCAYRSCMARRRFAVLEDAERARRRRLQAASTLQRFVRFHLRRKERLLIIQARHVSATLVQKYVRRMLAMRRRKRQLDAALTLQCWHRHTSAKRQLERLRIAVARLKHWFTGKMCERRWLATRRCVCQVQRWWRRSNAQRWEYLTSMEAAMCIQAVWRGFQHRQKWKWLEARSMEEVEEEKTATALSGELTQMIEPRENEEGSAEMTNDTPGGSELTSIHFQDAATRDHVRALNESDEQRDAEQPSEEVSETLERKPFEESGDMRVKGECEDPVAGNGETDDDRDFGVDVTDEGDQTLPPQHDMESAGGDVGMDGNAETPTGSDMADLTTATHGDGCAPGANEDSAQTHVATTVESNKVVSHILVAEENAKAEVALDMTVNRHEAEGENENHRSTEVADMILLDDDPYGENVEVDADDVAHDEALLPRTEDQDSAVSRTENPSVETSATTSEEPYNEPAPSIVETTTSVVDPHNTSDLVDHAEIRALLMDMVASVVTAEEHRNDDQTPLRSDPAPSSHEPSTTMSNPTELNDPMRSARHSMPGDTEESTEERPIEVELETRDSSRDSGDSELPLHASDEEQAVEAEHQRAVSPTPSNDQQGALETMTVDHPALTESSDGSGSHWDSEVIQGSAIAATDESDASQHVETSARIPQEVETNASMLIHTGDGEVAVAHDGELPREAGLSHPAVERQPSLPSDDGSHTREITEAEEAGLGARGDAAPDEFMLKEEPHDDLQSRQDQGLASEAPDNHPYPLTHRESSASDSHKTTIGPSSLDGQQPPNNSESGESVPHTAELSEPTTIMRERVSSGESDDSNLDSPGDSDAESDDLMLLDATAVTQFRQDDEPNGEDDRAEISMRPGATAPSVERIDSDKELLLDLEELSSTVSPGGQDTNPTQEREQVVVADLD